MSLLIGGIFTVYPGKGLVIRSVGGLSVGEDGGELVAVGGSERPEAPSGQRTGLRGDIPLAGEQKVLGLERPADGRARRGPAASAGWNKV